MVLPITEFFDAIKAGNLASVKSLLASHPNLATARNESDVSAVLLAVYYSRKEIVAALLAIGIELNIFEAAAVGNSRKAQELVEANGSVINSYSPDGFQPLGLAAYFGHAEIVEHLLVSGADPNSPSKNTMRVMPIHSAVANSNSEAALKITRLLLANGAEANVFQHGGWTPLHQAAAQGYSRVVELLLSHGAEVNAKSDDGRTPLQMAQEKGHAEVVAILQAHR